MADKDNSAILETLHEDMQDIVTALETIGEQMAIANKIAGADSDSDEDEDETPTDEEE